MNASTAQVQTNGSLIEPVIQQSPNVAAAGICTGQPFPGSNLSSSRLYGHNEMYLTPQPSHPIHQYQTHVTSYQQRPYHPNSSAQPPGNISLPIGHVPLNHQMPHQTPTNPFPYANHILPQNISQPYHLYSHQAGESSFPFYLTILLSTLNLF